LTPQTASRLAGVGHAIGRRLLGALAAAGRQVYVPASERGPTAEEFADAMAQVVSGVCVVTARGPDRRPHGLVATSFCSYSLEPPAVLVCLGRHGRARAAVASATGFGVHVLGGDQEDLARWVAAPGADRFDAVDWRWDGDVPALSCDHVVAYLRCSRAAVKRHGDHAIVIGCVERVDTAPREPLVYLRRRMDWRLRSVGDRQQA
jgi:flavin reductase ActVB